LLILEVCRLYGWTYDEYMSQPHWFTELAIERLIVDRKQEAKADGMQ
jgi:hypothetical protein